MSKVAVSIKIDLNKMDQTRIFHGKNGAQYLDATVFIDTDNFDQYGNSGMITQSVKKEEKDQGVKGNILGNVSVFWRDDVQVNKPQQGGQQQAPQQQYNQAPQQQQQSWGNAPQQQPPQQMAPAHQAAPQNAPAQRAPQQPPMPQNPATQQAPAQAQYAPVQQDPNNPPF